MTTRDRDNSKQAEKPRDQDFIGADVGNPEGCWDSAPQGNRDIGVLWRCSRTGRSCGRRLREHSWMSLLRYDGSPEARPQVILEKSRKMVENSCNA